MQEFSQQYPVNRVRIVTAAAPVFAPFGAKSGAMQCSIDGRKLAYDDAGSGLPIVLLHGFLLDRTAWEVPFAALARRTRVIAPDLRGAGESARGNGPALMESLAGDLAGLLDALGIERAIVAGHSLGGYVALAFFRMYAERVAGLGLVASHAGADLPERAAERDALAAGVEAEGVEPAIARYLPLSFDPRVARDYPALVARTRTIMERQDPGGSADLIRGIKERVASDDLLEDIQVPVLILAGEYDQIIPAASLRATADAIADCEFTLLPGVGHVPMFEAPSATTAALERLVVRSAVTR
jgi:3-oxoadipate enol-lactonase